MEKYKEIINRLIQFRNDRDWEQFHDSRNLALALMLEASELNEIFLWKKDSELDMISKEKIKEELADVLCYAFLLAEKYNLDIYDIMNKKIDLNENKYPIDKSKGTSKKYTEL